MSLDKLTADIEAVRNFRPRTFEQWCEWADPEKVRVVMEAVKDDHIQPGLLVDALRKNDIPITLETIGKYRDARG